MRRLVALGAPFGCLLAVGLGCGSGGAGGGGNTGSGGTPVIVSVGSTGSGGATGDCAFTQSSSTSPKIPTVAIVTFTTTLPSPTSAAISFGLDTSYGMMAPVDLTQASYRTLLLGMKPSKTYHFQISATNGSDSCASGDYVITTGAVTNGLPTPTITTDNASALYGGFLVTGQYSGVILGTGASGAPAFILDKDGNYVWWYTVSGSDATGVTMSYDGNYMWINSANVPNKTAVVHRVSMDGMIDEDHSSEFVGLSHQLTVLPDETVAFYAYGTNGCDDIKLHAPDGTVTTVVNARAAHGGSVACHVNAIFYSSWDDTLVFSDLDNNCLTKVTRSGSTVWVLNSGGGVTSSFSEGTYIWQGGEHGFHILGLDDFVIFNNNSLKPAGSPTGWAAGAAGDGNGSYAIEVKLDLVGWTASQIWSYQGTNPSNGNMTIADDVLGDAQRLPNGNTMVDFATKGTIQEIDANGNLLQQIAMPTSFGYIQKRATLYGPPPR
jgi:Arylsulfotransferase (ASST)